MLHTFSAIKKTINILLQQQKHKFQKRGTGLIISFLIMACFFTIYPQIIMLLITFLQNILPNLFLMAALYLIIEITILTIYNYIYQTVYKIKHPFFEKYRISNKPWPWQQNLQAWKTQLNKVMKLSKKNIIMIAIPFFIFQSLTMNFFGYQKSYQTLPSVATMIKQSFMFLFVQDFLFYTVHRLFHHPKLYWIHKTHHQFNNTVAIAATHAHPIEFFFADILPFSLGFKILSFFYPVHLTTIFVWVTFRFIQGIQGHSGYQWSWSITNVLPFGAGSRYHNFHHSHNAGNYGSFFIFWDSLNGTNEEYFKYIRKQKKEKIENQTSNDNHK